jgi:hypothetical protein
MVRTVSMQRSGDKPFKITVGKPEVQDHFRSGAETFLRRL